MMRLRVEDFKTVEDFNQKFKMYLNQLLQAKVKLQPVVTITNYLVALSDKFPAFTARIRADLTLDVEELPDLDLLMAQLVVYAYIQRVRQMGPRMDILSCASDV